MPYKAASILATLALSGAAFAQAQTAAPEPDYSLSYNVGVVSDYRYRGISQTAKRPALQGGGDLAHKSGFYIGPRASAPPGVGGRGLRLHRCAQDQHRQGERAGTPDALARRGSRRVRPPI